MASSAIRIFVLIDALGWEYVRKNGFLADVLPYRRSLRTVLGFSSGAIPTILTGTLPARHGLWNLLYYDPHRSPFRWLRPFRVLPDGLMNHRVAHKAVKEIARRVLGLDLFECYVSPKLLPWFNWAEPGNIYRSGGIPGGNSIFDRLAAAGVPHRIYSYHDGSDAELLRRATEDIRKSRPGFLFVYLSEFDAFLHHRCNNAQDVSRRMKWYERKLRDLLQEARRRTPSASLTVFSDHGMTPVDAHVDLAHEIERLGLRMPQDYLAVYDATMARFWFMREEARRAIGDLLESIPCGRLLSDGEREDLGIAFRDDRYGEAIFLLNPGCLIASSGFHKLGALPIGMHGYHPDDKHSDACFLSTDPPSVEVSGIQDIYAVMQQAV